MIDLARKRWQRTTALAGVALIVLVACALGDAPGSADEIGVASGSKTTATASVEDEFVGRSVCGECHQKNFEWHSKHGHASTFAVVAETSLPEFLNGKTFDAGPDFGVYQYDRDSSGGVSVSSSKTKETNRLPLQYVLGSGMHARTMLTLQASADGKPTGVEHRATVYAKDRLGVTPGHAGSMPGTELELFGDVHSGLPLERCVYCHTTTGDIVGEQVANLTANVNCEKCHGPGGQHVQQARANIQPLPAYSVGKSSWDAESEIQLCGDCHRMPRDISEREVRDYPDVLVRFQPIGMLRSRCYLESDDQLRCTSCHNPHQTLQGTQTTMHEQKCLKCHDSKQQSHVVCSVSTETGCIECHMPAIEVVEGLRFHDHWIRIRDDKK